ncbi:MAG: hypothetical protein ACP5IL_11005 [Syntrophobacteraceae bacterium]
MAKNSFTSSNSFRKTSRKISIFPEYHEDPVAGWKPELNESVLTPSGTGTVVEISKGLYLVDLEDQTAKVWERVTSLRRPL